MRALLVVNPKATATTPRTLHVLVNAISNDLKVEIVHTTHRGHAQELTRDAAIDGFDLVVALGGDGTVNECVNGMLADGPGGHVPRLGVVPGGSANVFARALGLPNDPVEATGALLDALRDHRSRSVGLGRVDERWFTFCAGLGFDAEIVADVERLRSAGRPSTPSLYVRRAVGHYLSGTDRRHGPLTLERPGEKPLAGLFVALVANTAPWTYFGRRPVDPCPDASFDTGLDALAMRRFGPLAATRAVRGLLGGTGRGPRGRAVIGLHDQPELTVRAAQALPLQVDGDHVGEHTGVTFRSVPRALRVLV